MASVVLAHSAPAHGDDDGGRAKEHITPLDGLRGLAAMIVLLAHLAPHGLTWLITPSIGTYGVLLFFILSGFLMGFLNLHHPPDRKRIASYVAARVSRIVPLYYAIVLVSFIVFQFIDRDFPFAVTANDLLRLLLFVGSTGVFWSIGPEFYFYFFFILVWIVFAAQGPRGARLRLALIAALVIVYATQELWPGQVMFSKLHIFMVGVALAMIRRQLSGQAIGRIGVVLQIPASVILLALLLPTRDTLGLLYPVGAYKGPKLNEYYGDMHRIAIMSLVVYAFTYETRFARALFGNPAMRALGNYSFSIYLLHVPIIYILDRAGLFRHLAPLTAAGLAAAAVLMASAVSYRLIEYPSRRHLRLWLEPRLQAH